MSKIIVALDGLTIKGMMELVTALSGKVWGFKVNDMLVDQGCRIIQELKPHGKVFADVKLFDIPNTVANSVSRLVKAKADLITVHASGGSEMLKAAVENGKDRDGNGVILAVTVLTSMSDEEMNLIYGGRYALERLNRTDIVGDLASIAQKAGVWGVVCAPGDIAHIPAGVRTVVPGFRPDGKVELDDQKNTGGFTDVEGANLIVVGRPITYANDPVAVAEAYNAVLEGT